MNNKIIKVWKNVQMQKELMLFLKDFYERQGKETPIGAQYKSHHYGPRVHFYYNDRFNRSISLLPKEVDNLKVLDIGYGYGVYTLYLAMNGADVVALELSKNYLLKTKQLYNSYKKQIKKQIRYVQANASYLPFNLHFLSEKEMIKILKEEKFRILRRNYGYYFFPLLVPFLGKYKIVDTLFLKFENVLSKTPFRCLAWNIHKKI